MEDQACADPGVRTLIGGNLLCFLLADIVGAVHWTVNFADSFVLLGWTLNIVWAVHWQVGFADFFC